MADGGPPLRDERAPTPVASLVAVLERMAEPGGLDELDETGLLEVAAAFARVESFGAAGVRAAAGALSTRVSLQDRCIAAAADLDVSGLVADEIAIRLGVSRTKAAKLVGEGRAFAGLLCEVGDALADGDIDAGKAGLFVERLADQPDIVALAVCELVLPDAPTLSHHALGRAIDRALIGVDPQGSQARHLAADARRRVSIRRRGQGMAVLTLHAPIVDVALIDATLERIARAARAHGDARSLDQLRADSLVSAVQNVASLGELTLRPGPPPAQRPVAQSPANRQAPGARAESAAPAARAESAAPAARAESAAPAARAESAAPVVRAESAAPVARAESAASFAPAPGDEAEAPPSRIAFRTSGLLTLRLPAGRDAAPAESRPSLAQIYEAELCAGGVPSAAGEKPGCGCGDLDLDAIAAVPSRELAAPVAELIGVGPVPPGVAEALSVDPPRWLRIVQPPDPAGEPPAPAPGYRPTAALDRWVRERDGHCVAPGCAVPSARCDLDHLIPYPQGPTSADNLYSLCRHHHLIKTHAQHRLGRDLQPGGEVALTWRTRLGQMLRRDAASHQWSRASSQSPAAQPP